MERQEFDVWSFVASYQNLFSETFLLILETIDLLMLRDTKDISYISFKNGILKVISTKQPYIQFIRGLLLISAIWGGSFIFMKELSPEVKGVINYITLDVVKPEKLYGIELQNIFIECVFLTKAKDAIYSKCLMEMEELTALLNNEIQLKNEGNEKI